MATPAPTLIQRNLGYWTLGVAYNVATARIMRARINGHRAMSHTVRATSPAPDDIADSGCHRTTHGQYQGGSSRRHQGAESEHQL
jgi:hypothetical protein